MYNDMNSRFLKLAYAMTTALLLAACSQNEVSEQGTILPEVKYPLEIFSVTMSVESSSEPWSANAPQARVTENMDRNSSLWQTNDKIGVHIGDNWTTLLLKEVL